LFRYLDLSHLRAAATSVPSAVQTCSTSSAPFPYNDDPCLWDDNTTARLFESSMSLYFSSPNMPHECPPVRTMTFGRTSNWERCLGGQWIRNERGLAMGWAVWRWSYLNRNASAASSGLGPSESVEAQDGERAGSQSLTTRNGMQRAIETMVIHDGKDASFCRSCRFVCSFIAHFPPFLPTSIILVQILFYLLTSGLLSLRIFSHSPSFTAQRSSSLNSLSPPSLFRLSQTNKGSCNRPLCSLC
jgi:hypothetical protein